MLINNLGLRNNRNNAIYLQSLKFWKAIIKDRGLNTGTHLPYWKKLEMSVTFLRAICAMQTWFSYADLQKTYISVLFIYITLDS